MLLAVLRKTEGYGKQEDDLSASQLASLCGAMSRQHVTTALNELAALNVIRKRPGRYGCVVGLNRDPAQWRQPAGARACPGPARVRKTDPCPNRPRQTVRCRTERSSRIRTNNRQPSNRQPRQHSGGEPCLRRTGPPPVIALALKDGSEYAVTESQAAEWRAAYRELNVDAELLRMRAGSTRNRRTARHAAASARSWWAG